ncbi:MAG: hypothetical protein KJ583_06610 [Nanoarchaeota archaeon]|nr:hypothetical protein [Nanoarchaeota archaeon]MBU1269062.1 hypothetical protein [Nanoarchaeota archaeon]MBU1604957.1 hypothetical protein [Nanoarchaeota archaeon]
MNRRNFLNVMGKGITVLAVGGLENLLSGCATTLPRVSDEELTTQYNSIIVSINDPNNYLRFLQEREYVVPNKVFEAYAKTIDKRPQWLSNPSGGYLEKNYLDTNEEKKEIIERFNKLGLNKNEITIYSTLFTSSDIIILKESVLKDKSFEKVMPHERFHKKMKKLSNEDYNHMIKVANELLERRDENDFRFVQERDDSKYAGGFAEVQAHMNHEEFYTYLAQGEFILRVEEALKKDYKKAYEIFDEIRNACKLK